MFTTKDITDVTTKVLSKYGVNERSCRERLSRSLSSLSSPSTQMVIETMSSEISRILEEHDIVTVGGEQSMSKTISSSICNALNSMAISREQALKERPAPRPAPRPVPRQIPVQKPAPRPRPMPVLQSNSIYTDSQNSAASRTSALSESSSSAKTSTSVSSSQSTSQTVLVNYSRVYTCFLSYFKSSSVFSYLEAEMFTTRDITDVTTKVLSKYGVNERTCRERLSRSLSSLSNPSTQMVIETMSSEISRILEENDIVTVGGEESMSQTMSSSICNALNSMAISREQTLKARPAPRPAPRPRSIPVQQPTPRPRQKPVLRSNSRYSPMEDAVASQTSALTELSSSASSDSQDSSASAVSISQTSNSVSLSNKVSAFDASLISSSSARLMSEAAAQRISAVSAAFRDNSLNFNSMSDAVSKLLNEIKNSHRNLSPKDVLLEVMMEIIVALMMQLSSNYVDANDVASKFASLMLRVTE